MKIFITGATGFIGSHLIDRLAQTEHELYCLVRTTSQAREKLQASKLHVIEGDIMDKESILQAMDGCDWVLHLAGLYSFWERNNKLYREINVTGIRNVMECALETKVSKVVHVSTAVVYGLPSHVPFTEDDEVGSVRFSEYARTKYEGEQIVWDLHKNNGLPVVVVYPLAVLGAGDPKATGQYISDFVRRRLPSTVFNNSTHTYVHVNDVADAIIRAAEKPDNIGEKYLIGKHQFTLTEYNTMISELSGVSIPKMHMPDFLAISNAYMLTAISRLTGKQPPWGMSVDQVKTIKNGFIADGSKAERELGLTYTPISEAIEEEVAATEA